MYVELSPRQSGKTTRLIEAVCSYLNNPAVTIAVVTTNSANGVRLKRNFIRLGVDVDRITFMSGNLFGRYNREPDYWFFDEFGYIKKENLLHPIFQNVIQNGYYCTTPPAIDMNSTDIIVDYCIRNNIQIHFNNPWTEHYIQEQRGFVDYIRESVLGDWVSYMELKGLMNGIKINLIRKEIKKHRFTSW